ncbi:MAG TPA: phosphate acetyltransferase [Polyangiales bacterium]|nr:phosphate acetyltransferase [Polyangiales bacterium]
MAHIFYLTPSGSSVGLTSVALGVLHALDKRGIRVAFFKPVGQVLASDRGPERSTHFAASATALRPVTPIPLEEAERMVGEKRADELLERVIRNFRTSVGDADVVIVEGLVHTQHSEIDDDLNRQLIQALSAEVIIVGALRDTRLDEFQTRLRLTAEQYGGLERGRIIGCIINRVRQDGFEGLSPAELQKRLVSSIGMLGKHGFQLIGAIPENAELGAQRTLDIARHLGATVLHEGALNTRRVRRFTLLARTVANFVDSLIPGSLFVTPSDRCDAVLAVAMAAVKNVPIAGLVITGEGTLPPNVVELCAPALATGMPLLGVSATTWETAAALMNMSSEVPADDLERVRASMSYVADHLDGDWLVKRSEAPIERQLSPAAFCYRLVEVAARANARIVLPEGNEPRTIKAAIECVNRNIARCVLLGDPKEVRAVAQGLELALPDALEILDPASIRANYVAPLVELRKHKGLTEEAAAELLEDNVWLGTVMLARGEVSGLVSGAVHSTANTIRPALQIIRTKPGARVVSSIFFMCLPEQVVVYGDCAVIPDPDAETLADIAIQSADSAARFGIEPRVAMISYSTGESGAGADVDKVREATRIAKRLRPDLCLDGPMQYDAAEDADVARAKAPNSSVAGRATVFIFPDLNTGNTTYKAVQRSANVVSIGPMLQGLAKPVNDLSRGALVEDIVYTIAITAIQAGEAAS